ncbi:hypothetical protein KQJ25_23645, partial [Escherichia sp. S69_ASV_4]|nr:hypothetical protein [Escherichia sp. S69_ASV_4]
DLHGYSRRQRQMCIRDRSYPVLRLKRLGLSKTFRRLVVTLIRRYGVSLIHLDASAECLPGLPTFDW